MPAPYTRKYSCIDNKYQPTLRTLLRRNKFQHCHLFPTLTAEDLDQARWKQKVLECDKLIKRRCPVSFSERMFNQKF